MNELPTQQIEAAQISRRRLLTRILPGMAVTIGGSALLTGCENPFDSGDNNPRGPETSTTLPTPAATETPEPLYPIRYTVNYNNIQLRLDKDSIPVDYLQQNDTNGKFENPIPFDRPTVLAARDKAIASGQPEMVKAIPYKNDMSKEQKDRINSTEHGKLSSLPDDVITEAEVVAHGITIVQPKNGKFHIRRQAFEPGAPLEDFNNTGRQLRMVFVDGPVVHSAYMKDPKYDGIKTTVTLYERTNSLQLLDTESMRAKLLLDYSLSDSTIDAPENLRRTRLTQLIEEGNEEFIQDMFIAQLDGPPAGLYDQYFAAKEEAVYIAAGNINHVTEALIGFGSTGEFIHTLLHQPMSHDYRPQPYDSMPNPNDYPIDPSATPDNPKSYPIAGVNLGFVVLHELSHDKLIETARRNKQKPNRSEYDTDIKAMQYFTDASQKWTSSGFTDNTGYFFAWEVPVELGGGIIVTKNLQNTGAQTA